MTPALVAEWRKLFWSGGEREQVECAFVALWHWMRHWDSAGAGDWIEGEGAAYGAAAKLLADLASPKRGWAQEGELELALRAVDRLEADAQTCDPYPSLVNAAARLAWETAGLEDGLAVLSPERIELLVACGSKDSAWALATLAEMMEASSQYAAASRYLDEAQRLGGDAHDLGAFVAGSQVRVELERGRVDWAIEAWRRQEEHCHALGSANPLAQRRFELNRLQISNARGDYETVRELAKHLMPPDGEGFRSAPGDDWLVWSARTQLAQAMLRLAPERGAELAASVVESEAAGALNRGYCALHLAISALDGGDLASARELLQSAEAILATSTLGAQHVIRTRVAIERTRLARLAAGPNASLEAEWADCRASLRAFRAAWEAARGEEDGTGFLLYDYRRELLAEAYLLAERALPCEGARAWTLELAAMQELGGLTKRLGADDFDCADAEARLRARGEGLVAFVPGRSRLLVLLLDGDGPAVFDLGEVDRALDAARALGQEIREPSEASPDRWRELAEAAGARLFPPPIAARVREWQRISFVQPELLGGVPLEVLAVEGIGVLGLARPITSYATLPAWIAMEERAERARERDGVVALVDPALAPGRVRALGAAAGLAGTYPESCLPGEGRAVLAGDAATLEAFAAALPGRDVAVLWTHGHWSKRAGDGPGIELAASPLAPAGLVHARELERSLAGPGAPRIVVLGICGAARPHPRPGDDASIHLGGTFMGLGADVVLAAAHDVHALSAKRVVDVFLASLARAEEGGSPAEALLAARRSAASEPLWSHPHYWAALRAMGVAHRARIR